MKVLAAQFLLLAPSTSVALSRSSPRLSLAFGLPQRHAIAPYSVTIAPLYGRGRGAGGGEDKISRGKKKGDLPEKICVVCGRPFTWRKKWEKVWDEVKYCSDRCRNSRGGKKEDEGRGASQSSSSDTSAKAALGAVAGPLSRRGLLRSGFATMVGASLLARARGVSAAPPALRPAPGVIESVLEGGEAWPEQPPFSRDDFARLDESDDSLFYDSPKLVQHVDDAAVRALERYYGEALEETAQRMYGQRDRDLDILDLGASWVSHLPAKYRGGSSSSRVVGLGMNAEELKKNPQLTEWVVQDLNRRPKPLPFADGSFDAVVCSLTIDYLTKPVTVTQELARLLRPGGLLAITFSNRLFITKAVGLWTGALDEDHVYTVGAYLHYGGGGLLSEPSARDLSPSPSIGDPLYAVYAYRLGGSNSRA